MEMKMRFPDGKTKAVTLSYDDGSRHDVRLVNIMTKYGLKGTFNINSGLYASENEKDAWRLTKEQCVELYNSNGMEVAVHGLTHPFLEQLPATVQKYEVLQDRINLEEEFNSIVRGMAYPFGTFNNQVIETLKECGIVYSRTVESTGKFALPSDWLRMPATCHHNDPRLFELVEEFIKDDEYGNPKLFYLWGHSHEFAKDNNWDVIEKFAECIGNREEIWYATNIEVYEYVEAYRNLIMSMDGKRVYNPTGCTVCFENGDTVFCVKPGEIIRI
ncbi:MAG: polysaccharide deacetylase family protein [Tyzzerella sp.]|nr:polysaccharide deacetylase family protein [Tyzzerella sp.]